MKSKDLRAKAVQELIKTEESYIKQLCTLKKYFVDPCAAQELIPTSVHVKLFGEFPALHALNTELYEKLCLPLCNSLDSNISPERNNFSECDITRFLEINVGEAFLEIAPFFKVYASYASNYQQNLLIIKEQENASSKFHSFLRNTEARPEVQCKLISLLIVPIQRLPRYTLLLTEILRHIPHGHPYKEALERSVSVVAGAAQRVDDCVGEGQHTHLLLSLQKALVNQKPNIITPGRKLLKSGLLHKANRTDNKSVARIFFLFSDMLMYTKVPSKQRGINNEHLNCDMSSIDKYKPDSLTCCCMLPLRHCSVVPLFSQDDNTSVFKVTCNSEELTLHSTVGNAEGQAWISTLRSAITVAVTNRKTLKKDSSAKRPLRRPDIKRGLDHCDSDRDLQQLQVTSPRCALSPIAASPTPSSSSITTNSSETPNNSSNRGSQFLKYLKAPPKWKGSNSSVQNDTNPPPRTLRRNTLKKNEDTSYKSPSSHPQHSNISRLKSVLRSRKRCASNEIISPLVNRNSSAFKDDDQEACASPLKIRILDSSPGSSNPRAKSNPYSFKWDTVEMKMTPEKENPNSFSNSVKPKLINNHIKSNKPTPVSYNSQRPFSYFPGKTLPSINGYSAVRPVFNSDKLMQEREEGGENVAPEEELYATITRRKRNLRRRSKSLSSFKTIAPPSETAASSPDYQQPFRNSLVSPPKLRFSSRSKKVDAGGEDYKLSSRVKSLSQSVEHLDEAPSELWKRNRMWTPNKLLSYLPKKRH